MEPSRILFASRPFDGHFNPMTGIAKYLQGLGHDVRWYAGASYHDRLERLGIPHLPFRKAIEVNGDNVNEYFPERAGLKGLGLLRFEFKNVVIGDSGANFDDIADIFNAEFAFDMLICDGMFFDYPMVAGLLKRPVYVVHGAPMMLSSKDTPPNFAGLTPAKTGLGRFVHQRMRSVMERMSMTDGLTVYHHAFTDRGMTPPSCPIFDLPLEYSVAMFQSGVPGFAFPRRDLDPKVVFVGPLLPYRREEPARSDGERSASSRKVILISQGTVDNDDQTKLIIPALDGLRGSGHRLLVTTGGVGTAELRQRYPDDDIVIEDYLDFGSVLDSADLFICNGGYGSILLSLSKGVPVLSAGIREGKNDVNAHVRYFKVGTDLKTETPRPDKIRRAVEALLVDPEVKVNVARLADELGRYRPEEIITEHLFDVRHESAAPA